VAKPTASDRGDDWSAPRATKGAVLARATERPVPAEAYPHDCIATRPGWLPWFLWVLLAAFTVLVLAESALHAGRLPEVKEASWRAGLLAATVLALFWLVGWEWRRTPRGILLAVGERNVCSLSIAQAMAWTALLVAVTVVAVLAAGGTRAVESLGTLQAGLGVGAAAGAGLALGSKSGNRHKPTPEALRHAAKTALRRGPEPYVSDVLEGRLKVDADFSRRLDVLKREAPGGVQVEDLLGKIARGMPVDKALGADLFRRLQDAKADLSDAPKHLEAGVRSYLERQTSGVVYSNGCPCESRLTDMLQGDETSNTYQFDPNKLQFLALTLLGLFVYLMTMARRLDAPFGLVQDYPGGILAAVGLSGASYVGLKLPVQTKVV
jgi:hypothetical protein